MMPRSRSRSRHHLFLHNYFPCLFLCTIHFLLLILSQSITTSVAANTEATALLKWVAAAASNDNHQHFSNWNPTDSTPCKWEYITCSDSKEGVITEISIESVQIGITLPPWLPTSLPSLTKLKISLANLSGPIPTTISTLTSLAILDLSSNSLTGPIPSDLPFSLRQLHLFDNQLSGQLPRSLANLSSLEILRLGGNKDLAGTIPTEIGNCGNLTVLGLADTKISGSIPASVGVLSKLQTISIYTAMLSGEIPPEIGNCSELVNVFLYENSLSGFLPRELGKLKKLEKLLLWQNELFGPIPEEIGNCTSLTMIDLSINSISGIIPDSFGQLVVLEELMLSDNNVSGSIPATMLSNLTGLSQLQLDNNQISGLIPPEIGLLKNLVVFLAWQNQLEGSIPATLGLCSQLQNLDLSHNQLTGSIPPGIFLLKNLTKLMLLNNDISGTIPPEIGQCRSLVRLRLGRNSISGEIPSEIGSLENLNFLDLASNRLIGKLPVEMGNCSRLQLLDVSNNSLTGDLPVSLASIVGMQNLDGSNNKFSGSIPEEFGKLVSLNKLMLARNELSGSIPTSIGQCYSLQLLDLSSNSLSGGIPTEICMIEGLDIALNMSRNDLSGPIPEKISLLNKLSVLDLSYNKLNGNLTPLAKLENLVTLNVSYNNFTGLLPDTKLFRQLSTSDLAGNKGLCTSQGNLCFVNVDGDAHPAAAEETRRLHRLKLAIVLLITVTVAMVLGLLGLIRARRAGDKKGTCGGDSDIGGDLSWPWQFTPFQKLNFSVEQVVKSLVDANVIGKGCSGVVYRVEMDNGEAIAVKKLWPSTAAAVGNKESGVRDSFSAEVRTLGSIRHKNIVRFLGCCWNKNTRLLMYDYMANGSLGSLLHESNMDGNTGLALQWNLRYHIILGSAQGLAYLHHDCVPPIVHRDIKANNILIGLDFKAYIADFGLAKLVEDGDFGRSSNTVAGSYGYIAPEYGYMMKITEKSDVYSYGVVMLEVLTGKQPIDPTIPDGMPLVDWVRWRKGSSEVLDPCLRACPETEIEEILQTLGIALLCVNSLPGERPTMKDVAAMLKEIRHEREEYAKVDVLIKGSPKSLQEAAGVPATSSSALASKNQSSNYSGNLGNSTNTVDSTSSSKARSSFD